MLGQTVTVFIDRPMGTYHPKHKDIYYPVNYGYISGAVFSDGDMDENERKGDLISQVSYDTIYLER